ncbi:hypothetical protein BV25DRAFT_1830156 [Artomyces pyxidatus]|uniref:Uncharacterized protein n=1 Tax=Artomyces pyxidatus TaxID=48021 RepID=A0ACB8SPL9_9AGAM|nr:hypothetical protein BV25DRAFT_1830156 [Artomyces pyxidatus]
MSDLLGGNDDIDFDRAASAFPDISLDGDGDFPSFPATATNTSTIPAANPGFDLDDFDSPVRDVKVTGDEDGEIEKFENEFPDIEIPQESVRSPPQQPSFGAVPPFAPRPQQSALSSTPILTQQVEEEEPEVIREWRARQADEIRARDETSKARRQETISKAERAIDSFYEEYTAKKERQIRENKDEEQKYLANLTDALSHGTTWDRILDLVELQNSQSKTLARAGPGTTELSRYREVLLRLRREGTSAPGAAGY